jgi:Mrp family chromosome partitioning ATPase
LGQDSGKIIEQIRKLSPALTDLNHIEAGQEIRLPRLSKPVDPPAAGWGKRNGWKELRSERSQMSKNFELLQRVAKEELLTPAGMPVPFRQAMPSPALTRELANEEITKLVQRLFLHGRQAGGPRVVSFSGIARDDRSSWICACAGDSLASQADTSVCVVDANFWSPQLHAHFGVGNRTGLADALTTEGPIRSFATPLSSGNLWLMPSGSAKGDLYGHVERCRTRFAELREEFNYILLSAPPLTRETQATLMGQLADGIVLIVEANQTRRESVRQAKEHLETAQVQLLGAVLDQRTFPIPEFLYRKL